MFSKVIARLGPEDMSSAWSISQEVKYVHQAGLYLNMLWKKSYGSIDLITILDKNSSISSNELYFSVIKGNFLSR